MARCAKVVAIDGMPLASPGRPDKKVVSELQDILRRAKAGEIVAIAMAFNNADLSTGWLIEGNSNAVIPLIGQLEHIKSRVLSSIR